MQTFNIEVEGMLITGGLIRDLLYKYFCDLQYNYDGNIIVEDSSQGAIGKESQHFLSQDQQVEKVSRILWANEKRLSDGYEFYSGGYPEALEEVKEIASIIVNALRNDSEERILKKIIDAENALNKAKKLRCKCSGFVLQHEGTCQCNRGKMITIAQTRLIDAIKLAKGPQKNKGSKK